MRRANLYIRVSTDEQADKGYSLRSQEEVLRRYCDSNNIEIHNIFVEDYSAKTFNRPEWPKLMSDFKRAKGKVDLLLFTKWDRFSRNAGDAYQVLNQLDKLGVEAQAIEQPLDLSIPENKMMLAVYLAVPEVENDRRALNVIYGMRRAQKEGRWMNMAPIGYVNKTTENGRKYIAPKEPEASLIKEAFEELGKGILATEHVWLKFRRKGLKCSRNNFWHLVRNPVYCGKIFIPKFKNEESMLVEGSHQPLITDALFYKVQDVLDGRRVSRGAKITSEDKLPLRGFLKCPKCDKVLTGSASKGRSNHYYYYHCNSKCGFRMKAEDADKLIIKELCKYVPEPEILEIFKMVVRDVNADQNKYLTAEKKAILSKIDALNNKLSKARELLLTTSIDPSDYKVMKGQIDLEITKEEAKLSSVAISVKNIEKTLESACNALEKLDKLYLTANVQQKRELIGSIFPQKLVFEKNQSRTVIANEILVLISLISKELRKKKKGSQANFLLDSQVVIPLGLEPIRVMR